MKKFLILTTLAMIGPISYAAKYSVDTCYIIEKNMQIFDYSVIKGCQRIPDGLLLTFNKLENNDDKNIAFTSAAIAFGQNNHSLASQKYKMIITPVNLENQYSINWTEAKSLTTLSKGNKDIDTLIHKSNLLFLDTTPAQKSQNSLTVTTQNIEKQVAPLQNIVRGLPPPPPKLK